MKLNSAFTKLIFHLAALVMVPSTTYVTANENESTSKHNNDESNKLGLRNFSNLGKEHSLAHEIQKAQAQDLLERKLADSSFPCNEIIEIQSLANIKTALESVFTNQSTDFLDDGKEPLVQAVLDAGTTLVQEKIPLLEHDVQFMKVCASCESEGLSGYGCGVNDYGYDSAHSGLLLLPVDLNNETGEASIIDAEDELQTWFGMRSIATTQQDSDKKLYTIGLTNVEYALLAASMGLVAILPAQTGYGESMLIPSISDIKSKTTAALPLHSKAKSIVSMLTNGNTAVGDEAYFMGYSEGGLGAIAAAHGFEKHGITVVKAMSGGGPLKMGSVSVLGIIKAYFQGDLNPFEVIFVGLVGIGLSNTRPGPANYGTTQTALKPELVENFTEFFTNKSVPTYFDVGPAGFLGYIGATYPLVLTTPNYLSEDVTNFYSKAIEEGDNDPCANVPLFTQQNSGVDKYCESIVQHDLTDVVINAPFEIELCHARDDTLVVPESIPDASKLKYRVAGGHLEGEGFCKLLFMAGTTLKKPKLIRPKVPKSPKTIKASKGPKSPKGPKMTKASKDPKSTKAHKA